jgi:hypothetical protein
MKRARRLEIMQKIRNGSKESLEDGDVNSRKI